jgi:hypothetical protein
MNWEHTLADGAGTMTNIVPRDDARHIQATYGEFVEVFSKEKAETLEPHQSTDHAIDLDLGYTLPYGHIYILSEFELRRLMAYIEANLVKGLIQRSSS